MYLTGTFHNRIAGNDLTDAVGSDVAASGIFDGDDMAVNGGLHIGVFKGKVCIFHGAINEPQILAVAKGLRADDLQLMRVRPSENQARYSPFTVLLRKVTFLACQKASLVSR